MEHIVQIGIGIDDEAIKETIRANVQEAVVNKISEELIDVIFKRSGYNNKDLSLQPFAFDLVKEVFEDNKDTIINLSVKELAKALSKKKVVKDKLLMTLDEFE